MNNFWFEKITVGKLSFPRIMAAPLDGVTDSPLRQLIRHFSPDELLFGEMRHVACVMNERDSKSLKFDVNEHPIAYQVSANIPRFVDGAIERIIEHKFDMFNLNVGCPAKTVTRSGSGSALMADPERLKALLAQMGRALKGRIPFTLKMRAGYKEKNALEIAQIAMDAGIEMLIIHPRTAPEGFTSRLDFDLAKKVKELVSVPVIFSGNVNNFERAKKTYELTGVDGVMVGRALWGCPWKMAEMTAHARGEEFVATPHLSVSYALKHFELNMAHYGSHGFSHFKKQVSQYLRGIQNAAEYRKRLLTSQTQDEMKTLLEQIWNEQVEIKTSPPLLKLRRDTAP